MRCVHARMIGVALAIAASMAMPGKSQAQFGSNSRGSQSGSFGFSFGNGRGGSGFSVNINPGSGGGSGSRQYRQQAPGFNLNQPGRNLNQPGHSYNRQSPGFNVNVPGNGLLGTTSPWSGNNGWSNTPSYQPSYRPEPSYSPPSTSYAYSAPAPAASLPRPPAEPILIVNPADTVTPVHYKVNEYPYIMGSGQTQQLQGHTAWTIDFHRGGTYGRKKYALDPGKTYRFTPTPNGWDLYAVNPPVPPVPGLSANQL